MLPEVITYPPFVQLIVIFLLLAHTSCIRSSFPCQSQTTTAKSRSTSSHLWAERVTRETLEWRNTRKKNRRKIQLQPQRDLQVAPVPSIKLDIYVASDSRRSARLHLGGPDPGTSILRYSRVGDHACNSVSAATLSSTDRLPRVC